METIQEQARRFGYLFYVASPNATSFQTEEEIPDYVNNVVVQFLSLVLLEMVVLRYRTNKPYKVPLNDLMTSMGLGMIYTLTSAITKGVELVGYHWVYERRIITLNWDSQITWWTAAVGVDLGYYFIHRLVHENSLGWAAHQVHHSSEEYNLSTALRQSVFQKFFNIGFYLPLAFIGVPFPMLLVHLQFNLLYQFWIHTETITTLGPLEWIFNTPSHHRVHHGANSWCIDKNYAGVLIIWDRMFGTFEPERRNETISYGLVEQPQTFNVPYLQVFYYRDTLKRAYKQKTWADTVRTLVYGPGWIPGSPRLGYPLPETDPKEPPRKKYNPKVPFVVEMYLLVHFVVSLLLQQEFTSYLHSYNWWRTLLQMCFILVTIGNIGAMYDGWKGAAPLEAIRCGLFVLISSRYATFTNAIVASAVHAYCLLSAAIWIVFCVMQVLSGRTLKVACKDKKNR